MKRLLSLIFAMVLTFSAGAAQQFIVTTTPGTTAPVAGNMINSNFSEVYSNLTTIAGQIVALQSTTIPAGLTVAQLQILYPASNYVINSIYATADAGLVQGNGTTWVQGTTFTLYQSGVDFIYLPSGTMANNCSFTISALDNTYSSAYAYFPPGAIAASSQPGWFYVVMTSPTTGTCYNNEYVFGQPPVPTSLTPYSTTGPGAFTGLSGVGIPGPNVNIPPSSPGINGQINIKASWTANNNTDTKTLTFIYGSSNTGNDSETTTNTTNLITSRTIVNRGVTSAQVTTGNNGDGSLVGPNFEAVNGLVNQTLYLNFNRTAGTDFLVLHSLSIDLKPTGAIDAPAPQSVPMGSSTQAPACAAAFGMNTNKWFLHPTAASVSLVSNTTSPLFGASGQTQPHFTTVNGMLSLNQLGDGVNVGVNSINSSNTAGLLQTLPSANGWYIEGGIRITTNDNDHWQGIYSNPTEKFASSTTPFVEVDGDEQIGAISSNVPFNGSTESTLDWAGGSGNSGALVTHNNLNVTTLGFAIDRTQWHTYGYGYDPVSKSTFYCLDGTRQPYTQSTASFDSDINAGHYYLILNASSHGAHVPYSMYISYLTAWSTH